MKNISKKPWLIVVALILVIAAIAYFFFFKKSSSVSNALSNLNPLKGSSSTSTTNTSTSTAFPLKSGSRGAEVKALQQRLNEAYEANKPFIFADGVTGTKPSAKLTIDSIWGTKTDAMFRWATAGASSLSKEIYDLYISDTATMENFLKITSSAPAPTIQTTTLPATIKPANVSAPLISAALSSEEEEEEEEDDEPYLTDRGSVAVSNIVEPTVIRSSTGVVRATPSAASTILRKPVKL